MQRSHPSATERKQWVAFVFLVLPPRLQPSDHSSTGPPSLIPLSTSLLRATHVGEYVRVCVPAVHLREGCGEESSGDVIAGTARSRRRACLLRQRFISDFHAVTMEKQEPFGDQSFTVGRMRSIRSHILVGARADKSLFVSSIFLPEAQPLFL